MAGCSQALSKFPTTLIHNYKTYENNHERHHNSAKIKLCFRSRSMTAPHLSSSASSNCPGTEATVDMLSHVKLTAESDWIKTGFKSSRYTRTTTSAAACYPNFRGLARDYGERRGESSSQRFCLLVNDREYSIS